MKDQESGFFKSSKGKEKASEKCLQILRENDFQLRILYPAILLTGVMVMQLLSHVRLFCHPIYCSLQPASLPGIHWLPQARILEWVAISFLLGVFLTQGSNSHLLHCRLIL